MKFLSDIRLLLIALWLGAAVFFIGVAQNAFAVVQQRDLAGAVVGRNLSLLNYCGVAIAVILMLTSLIGTARMNKVWVWIERFLLLVVGAACIIGQWVIGTWISIIRDQIGRPIEELAADDPLRLQFNTLHGYSEWVLMAGMIAALLAFFIIANRRFIDPKPAAADPYDFSKEFKI
jgi:hypothetical protein